MGPIWSLENLKRKKSKGPLRKKEFYLQIAFGLKTTTSTPPSVSRLPACYRFWTCQPPQLLKLNHFAYTTIYLYDSISILSTPTPIPIPISLPTSISLSYWFYCSDKPWLKGLAKMKLWPMIQLDDTQWFKGPTPIGCLSNLNGSSWFEGWILARPGNLTFDD